jgi:mono/diheme cytochrome c family protein
MRHSLRVPVALAFAAAALAAEKRPGPEQARFFEGKVRPLLVEHCQQCHGPKKQQGGLRLDTAAGFRAGGDSGPLVTPGKPDESLLLRAVRHEGPKMPPKKQLAPPEVAVLAEWVRQGAPWPEPTGATRSKGITAEERAFWAFQPVRDPAVPAVKHADRARNAIDRFLLAKLEAAGLSFAPTADRRTLLRRVTYDLTGLPPTPDEVATFLADRSPDAYEKAVDRLLASPAYGERWGRHWLDVVRYADTAGDNSDFPVPQLYKYRNRVLASFNRDQPFAEFIEEQLAGDLMPADNPALRNERLIATGYLANARRFGSYEDKRYQWYLTFEDTIENLGRTFLGLSLSCARCHDHKFDPIPSEDYYALYGFFQSTRYPWPGTELDQAPHDLVPLDPPEVAEPVLAARKAKLEEIDKKIRDLQAKKDKAGVETTRKEKLRVEKEPLPLNLAYAVAEGQRWIGNAKMQMRGDPLKLGREVPRHFLQVLGGQELPPDAQGSGRLQLARWISDAKNPLTARVLVNRLWHYHFGRGIVPTPNDFGRQGQPPTHPELLDWLASRFVEGGGSIKAMHRLMVLSSAYQLAGGGEDLGKADPDNRLYGRFERRRLDAESIRDTLLQLAGVLDRSVGGPHPFPDQRKWDYTQHNPFKAVYETDRRSVYLMTQRIQRHPYLALFDGADTNQSTARRDSSTTPLQALFFLNDPQMQRLAKSFAASLQREAADDGERVERAFLLAFARPPEEGERVAAREFLGRVRERLTGVADAEARTWRSFVRGLLLSNELVYID